MKTFTILKKNVVRKRMAALRVGLIALFLLFAASLSHAATKNATTTGNWSTITWSPAGVPAAGDDIIINNGITVTVNGTITCNSLTFFSKTSGGAGATGTLTVNSPNSLTVTNAITVPSGKADGTFTITGTGTVSSATLAVNDAATPGGSTINLFTLNSTITTLNVTGNVSLVATGSAKFNNPILNLQSGTLSVGGTITVTTPASASSAATLNMNSGAASGTLILSGTTPWSVTQGAGSTLTITLNGATATVNYNAATGGQPILASTYTTLTLGNTSGTQTAGGNLIVTTLNNNTNAADILNMGTNTLAATTVNNSGTIRTQNTSGTPLPTGLTWGGTVNYDAATGAQTVVTGTYGVLTLGNASGTQTAGGNLIVTTLNNNTNAADILNMGANTLAVTTVNNSGTIRTQNTSGTPLPTGLTWAGTVNYDAATGTQTVVTGTYGVLTLSNTSGTQTAGGNLIVTTLNNNTNVADILNMGTNTLAATTVNNSGTIRTQNISGTPLPTGLTWGGTVNYDAATGTQTVVTGTYGVLTLGNTSGTQAAGGNLITTTLNTTAGGTLNMGTNTLSLTNVTNAGIIRTQNTTATPIPTGKTWGGTVNYDAATGAQTVAAGTYGVLTLGNTSGTQTAGGNLTVTTLNNNTNAADILNMGANTLTVTIVNNSGTIRTQNTSATPFSTGLTWGGLVQYDGVAQTVSTGTYNNITLTGSLAKTFPAGTTTVNGILSMEGTATAILTGTLTYGASATLQYVGSAAQTTGPEFLTPFGGSGGVIINNSFGVNLGGSKTITNGLTLTSGTLGVGTNTLTLNGAVTVTSGSLTSSATGTVIYGSGSSQNILAANYGNLTSSGAGARTLAPAGTIGIAGAFTPGANSYTITGSTISFTGTSQTIPAFTYNILSISGSTTPVLVNGGTITIAGTFTPGAGVPTVTGNTISFTGISQTIPAFTFNNLTISGSTTPALVNGGTITIAGTFTPGAVVPTVTGNTIAFTGTGQTIPAFTYNNLTISGSTTPVLVNGGTITIAGTFTPGGVVPTVTGNTVQFNGASQTVPAFNYNNLDLSAATTAITLASSGTIVVAGTFTVPGAITKTITGSTVSFNGSGSQNIPAFTFNNLTINNSAGVTLTGDATVNATLTFTSGKITTSTNKIILGSSATVSGAGAGKYVYGNLQKVFLTGAQSFTFDIGDVSNYAPAAIAFANVTTGGGLTVNTTSGQHPNIATSGINSSKDINRYWTLTNAGILFTNYSATYNFVSGDILGSANTSNFVVRNYSGSAWATTTIGTKTTTSTQATGLTSFSDFAIGEQLIDHYLVSATSPQTAGTAFNTTVTAQDVLNTTVSTDNSTVVTMSGTGNLQFDSDGNGTFGDNTKILNSGAFAISTKDNTAQTITVTATDGNSKTGTSGSVTVDAGTVSKLVVTLPGQAFTSGTGNSGTVTAQTAATAFNITSITTTDTYFNTVTSYSGSKTISYTGSTGTPSYTTAVSFTNGQSTTTLATTLTKAEATTITAGDGTITGPASSSLTVNVGTASKLVVTLPGQTFTSGTGNSGTVTAQTAGTAFNITSIIATDAGFNTVTSYSGSKTISYTGPTGTPSYTTAVSFTNGQSTTTLATTLTKAEATTITAGDGTITGPASSSLTVSAASMNKFAFSLASPQTNAAAFTGTNTLTAQDTYGNTVTPFNASSNNVTITASPADGTIIGLGSGNSNVLNQAIDFTSGIANIQNKMIFTGTIGSHTFTATSSTGGYTGTSGSVTINAATYVWNHSVSTDWQVANNWTPLRTTATTSDILAFNGGGSVSVTNVPTQTIAQLLLSNSSTVNLQPAASSNGLTVNDVLTTTAGDILNLGSGIILGGTLTTLINSGRIQTAVITTTSATPIPASLTWGGTVEYNGSGAQTAVGGTYTTLEINNSTGVTLANAATVTTLTMADVTSGSIFNDGGFAVSTANTLNLNSGTYNCSASAFPWGTVNAGTGTIDFNGTGPQTVPCLPYYSLRISGARTTNTVTLSSTDTIHVASGFMPVATFSGTGGYATTGTIFEYNGSAAQNVAAFTYNTLIMTNGGSNAKTFIGTDSVRENLVINGNATATGGSGNVVLFGNWTNNGTFSAGTSTVEFGGVPPTTINGASTFNTLAVNKQDSSTAITLNNNINVGTLTMTKGTMQTGSNSVTITGTRTGNALILGAVTRTHAFALSTPYAFEGPNTLINFTAGSTPSSVTVTVAQTTPTSPTMIPVDRSISISTTGGSFTATLRLHYENSETDNLDELGLRLWKDSSGTWLDRGETTRDSVNNYVELSGITAFSTWAIGASASSKTLVDNNGGSVNAGDTLTYTVTIVNPYKSTKPTINVNDALSSKFILVPGTISNSGAIAGQVLTGMNLEGGTITWSSFSLAGGASATRTFQLRSDSTISPSQTIANTARIDYGGGKVEYVSVSVTLTNLPNITITNAVDNIKPVPGDVLTFTLSVRNNGTSNATNITLNTAIPNNTTFNANGYGAGLGVQDDGVAKTNASDGDGVTYGGGSITVTISSLAPGTTTQIKFKTTVN